MIACWLYLQQDFVFLRSDIRFQFGLYYRTEDWSILSTEALQIITRGFEYAKEQLDTCIEDLQISKSTMLTAAPTHQLQKYIDFQHEALENESWISLHVLLLPCIIGYYEIAHRLKHDPFTRNDTVFYQLWIEPNSYPDDLEAYTDYLNKNLAHVNPHPIEVERWSALFRKACEMEISFLDTGLLNRSK
ncbi:ATP-dependent RNA helicase dbp2 [Ceratobasidium sp. 428]|nr:ATP-dependent RNA helicase dbp2 [Ceratobasidium sp. 428]